MKILCVEDGSVDLDALEEDGLKDGMILPYRQGSQPPFVLELDMQPQIDYKLETYRNLFDTYRSLFEEHEKRYNELKSFVIDTIMKYKDNIISRGQAFEKILDYIKMQEYAKDCIEATNEILESLNKEK